MSFVCQRLESMLNRMHHWEEEYVGSSQEDCPRLSVLNLVSHDLVTLWVSYSRECFITVSCPQFKTDFINKILVIIILKNSFWSVLTSSLACLLHWLYTKYCLFSWSCHDLFLSVDSRWVLFYWIWHTRHSLMQTLIDILVSESNREAQTWHTIDFLFHPEFISLREDCLCLGLFVQLESHPLMKFHRQLSFKELLSLFFVTSIFHHGFSFRFHGQEKEHLFILYIMLLPIVITMHYCWILLYQTILSSRLDQPFLWDIDVSNRTAWKHCRDDYTNTQTNVSPSSSQPIPLI